MALLIEKTRFNAARGEVTPVLIQLAKKFYSAGRESRLAASKNKNGGCWREKSEKKVGIYLFSKNVVTMVERQTEKNVQEKSFKHGMRRKKKNKEYSEKSTFPSDVLRNRTK